MRTLVKKIKAEIWEFERLSIPDQKLLYGAAAVRARAQSPYSHYKVGCAVLGANGKVALGCNVERASWAQTTHAEQNAIDGLIAIFGPIKLNTVAIVGAPDDAGAILKPPPPRAGSISFFDELPAPSCGHCLQIIWENCFGDRGVRLIALARTGEIVITTIGDALSFPFGPLDLGIDYAKVNKQ